MYENLKVVSNLLDKRSTLLEKLDRLKNMQGVTADKEPKMKCCGIEFKTEYGAHTSILTGWLSPINRKIVDYTIELLEGELSDIEDKLEAIDIHVNKVMKGEHICQGGADNV